ncbi:MAG: ketoacyl-ACP synthase III [Ilumatobacter sp.]|nr:ketoacyl-ACP synthase III [Ilumatobacter sp.]
MPQVNQGARGAVITGWGSALPTKILTNHDLEDMFETDHNWIVERTGIHERRVGGMTSDLSIESGRAALEMSGVDLDAIDALILATTTPDRSVPATASTVQDALGLHCGAFDVNAACSGWVYGLVTAHGLIAMGAEKILLIGTDTLARITDWDDRNTAILFADGSAATVLEAVDGPGQMLGWDLDSDGTAEKHLYAETGGTLQMEGKEVFRKAVRIMVDSAANSMAHAGVSSDDIALVVPHQANIRIISASVDRLGIPMERTSIVLDKTGNTSSASIPLALNQALEDGRVRDGDLVLFVGFGAGMSAASAVVRWNTTSLELLPEIGGASA